jgi:hypothetical protein
MFALILRKTVYTLTFPTIALSVLIFHWNTYIVTEFKCQANGNYNFVEDCRILTQLSYYQLLKESFPWNRMVSQPVKIIRWIVRRSRVFFMELSPFTILRTFSQTDKQITTPMYPPNGSHVSNYFFRVHNKVCMLQFPALTNLLFCLETGDERKNWQRISSM